MTAQPCTDLEALFRGLVFYGTGGGGRAAPGLALLQAHFGADWRPRFTDPATLPAEALACATIVVGGRDPPDDMPSELRRTLGLPAEDLGFGQRFAAAVRALERATGQTIAALAVVELGSLAMAATLIAADLLGKAVLDCDGTGRSIPELGLAKLDLAGLPAAPAAFVDRFGGETIVLKAAGAAMVDRLARQISRATFGRGLACAAYVQPMTAFRRGLVAGSIATAARIGTLLGDPAPAETRLVALLEATGGRFLGEGIAEAPHWRSTEPFLFRELDYRINGTGRSAGQAIRVFIKNEHHMVWRDDVLVGSSPDPIAVLDAATLEPLTTLGDVVAGRRVVVVAVPALDAAWRSAAGLALLGPQRFGFAEAPALCPVPDRPTGWKADEP